MDKFHLSKTEQYVMDYLWEQEAPVRQSVMLESMNEDGRDWKRQTLNTLLSRLEERGFVKRENHLVRAGYNKKEFELAIMQDAVDNYFDGKISKFFAAFVENHKISSKECKSLQQTLEKISKKK